MIRHDKNSQYGFSALELLITLFVATAFIGAGYQLYTTVIKNGGEAQWQSTANDIAYNTLRRYTPNTTNECTEQHYTPDSGDELPSAAMHVDITCPYGNGDSVSKIQVSVTYGTPTQEVIHAIYVNGD